MAVQPKASDPPEEHLENGATISPMFAFGVSGKERRYLVHAGENRVIFPVGKHVASLEIKTKEMSFLTGSPSTAYIQFLAIAPNKKYVATVETVVGSERPQVSIFNLQSERRVKTCSVEQSQAASKDITAVAFSDNSKLLMVLCGSPDYMLLCFKWYTARVVASAPCEIPAAHLSFNPWDNIQLVTCGSKDIQYWKLDADVDALKGGSTVSKAGGSGDFTAHAWLQGNMLALCTSAGEVHVYQDQEPLAVLATSQREALFSIVAKGHGFVTAGLKGVFTFFVPYDGPQRQSAAESVFVFQKELSQTDKARTIQLMSMAPTEANIVATTEENDLLLIDLTMLDEKDSEQENAGQPTDSAEMAAKEPVSVLSNSFHPGRLTGIDAIYHQPLLASIGEDRTVRVWNYQQRVCLLSKALNDDPYCVALHPSGFMILIGFSDRLRLYYILKADLLLLMEFPLKRCTNVKFSNGGHLFAAIGTGNIISIFETYSYRAAALLKGHVSVVTSICWAADDTKLASVGAGGACYQWNVAKAARIPTEEYVDKKKNYLHVAFGEPATVAFTRTMDGALQSIEGGVVKHELEGAPNSAYPIAVLDGNRTLLSATSSGSVALYAWPPTDPLGQALLPSFVALHGGAITHMAIPRDQSLLFTAGADGVCIMSSIRPASDGSSREPEPRPACPSVALFDDAEVAALKERIGELRASSRIARSEAEYQLIIAQKGIAEKLRDAKVAADNEHAFLNEKQRTLVQRIAAMEAEAARDLATLETAHASAAAALEDGYEQRLIAETDRYKELQAAKDDLQFRAEEKLHKLDAAHQQILKDTVAAYDARLEEAERRCAELEQAGSHSEHAHQEVLAQFDDEFEQQTDTMNNRINQERAAAEYREMKLKGKNHILKTGHYRMRNEKKQDAQKVKELLDINVTLEAKVGDCELTMAALREEVAKREAVITQNYETIQLLRRRATDLEKHKFVLSYRTQELAQNLEPKEEAIADLTNQLQQFDGELLTEAKRADRLARAIENRDLCIQGLRTQCDGLRDGLSKARGTIRTFGHEVSMLMTLPDTPSPGAGGRVGKSPRHMALTKLYKTYGIEDTQALIEKDTGPEEELSRQRDTVEAKNRVLATRLAAADLDKRNALRSRTQENGILLKELSEMKRDKRAQDEQLAVAQAQIAELRHQLQQYSGRPSTSTPLSTAMSGLPVAPAATTGEKPETAPGSRRLQGSMSLRSSPPTRPNTGGPQLLAAAGLPAPAVVGTGPASPKGEASRPCTADMQMQAMVRVGRRPSGGGTVVRGSPARVLNELVGVERERVVQLMGALAANSDMVEQQRREIASLRQALMEQASDEDEFWPEEGEGINEGGGGNVGSSMGGDSSYQGAGRSQPGWAVCRPGCRSAYPRRGGRKRSGRRPFCL